MLGPGHRGAGAGQALIDDCSGASCVMAGRRVMIAGIDAGNTGSIRFHERNGFRPVASMPGVVARTTAAVDLILMQRDLSHWTIRARP